CLKRPHRPAWESIGAHGAGYLDVCQRGRKGAPVGSSHDPALSLSPRLAPPEMAWTTGPQWRGQPDDVDRHAAACRDPAVAAGVAYRSRRRSRGADGREPMAYAHAASRDHRFAAASRA